MNTTYPPRPAINNNMYAPPSSSPLILSLHFKFTSLHLYYQKHTLLLPFICSLLASVNNSSAQSHPILLSLCSHIPHIQNPTTYRDLHSTFPQKRQEHTLPPKEYDSDPRFIHSTHTHTYPHTFTLELTLTTYTGIYQTYTRLPHSHLHSLMEVLCLQPAITLRTYNAQYHVFLRTFLTCTENQKQLRQWPRGNAPFFRRDGHTN